MQLNITFRRFEASESLKDYVLDKVERVKKHLRQPETSEVHVVLSLERHLHHADITLYAEGRVVRGHTSSDDMYAAIDVSVERIERQLRRHHDKIRHHHDRVLVHHGERLLEPGEVEAMNGTSPTNGAAPSNGASASNGAAHSNGASRTNGTKVGDGASHNGFGHDGVGRDGARADSGSARGMPRVTRSSEVPALLSPEDAAVQLDILGREFLVFRLAATGALAVIYRLDDGHYTWVDGTGTRTVAEARAR